MNCRETCCFFGHRELDVSGELVNNLRSVIERLIDDGVCRFLFGSKSEFNSLCLQIVSELKEKHPHITRVYVRAEFPYIDEDYRSYLLKQYEDTYYPDRLLNAGRAVYVERNYEMIDSSGYCVVYYDDSYAPAKRKSGTRLAYEYATKKGLEIVNMRVH